MPSQTSSPPEVPTPVRGITLTPAHELATGQLSGLADTRGTVDAADVIDHRTGLRVVAFRLAGRGHHLALTRGSEPELLPLEDGVTTVGRDRRSLLRLEDFRISREHALLVRHGRHMRLLDNRSSNGTYVNGRRIVAVTLTDGDLISFGSVAARYLRID